MTPNAKLILYILTLFAVVVIGNLLVGCVGLNGIPNGWCRGGP